MTTNANGQCPLAKLSLAEEKEMYLECLGHLMGLDFEPRSGLQLVPEGSRSTSKGEGEQEKVEISEAEGAVGGGLRTTTTTDRSAVPLSQTHSASSQRKGGETNKNGFKDDKLVIKDLSLELAKTWKTGAATATLAKFGINVQPKKQEELKKWEAFVFKDKESPINNPKSSSGSGRQCQSNGKRIQTGRDPSIHHPFVAPRPAGLSKLAIPAVRLHTIFNVPTKRPGPVLEQHQPEKNNDRPSTPTDSESSKRPKLSRSANAKAEERKNKKEKLDLQNQNLPSFQSALVALVEDDKKKGIKRNLDPLPSSSTGGGRRGGHQTGRTSPSESDDTASNNPELEELLAHEKMKGFEPKIVEAVLSEVMEKQVATAWDDVAGLAGPKAVIKEIIIWPMLRPDIFTGLRSSPKGILLFGPPGTGKTMIGRLIATQSSSTFFNISASSLTSKWIGDGEKMVRCLFQVARIKQPSVIFIDEIDSILTQRSETEHESSRRLKTEFLIQFDGCSTKEEDRVLVIGVTNRPHELDEAARRRLVKRIYIPLPDIQGREQIVQNLMRGQNCQLSKTDIDKIAEITEGYSGADMKSLCQEASYGPIRDIGHMLENISADNVRAIELNDFILAVKRVKSSVALKDLNIYEEWDLSFGCHIGE